MSFRALMSSISSCLILSLSALSLPACANPASEETVPLMSESRQLIFSGKRSGEGYFGADGNTLIFQSEREPKNPFFQIYTLNFDSGDTARVSTGRGKTTCAWLHPDGQRALFSSTHHDPRTREYEQAELDFRASGKQRRYSWDYDPAYEIYSRQFNNQRLTRLTNAKGYDAEGSYSPDGKQIVFASNRAAYTRKLSQKEQQRLKQDPSFFIDLYIMNSDGSNVRRLTDHAGYDGGPFFSPDGSRIVFRRFNAAGDKAEIWSMNTDGSDARALTQLGVMSWAPFYHPSGEYIIFATNKHGFDNFELYLVDAEGQKAPVRVTEAEKFDGLPVFSPDGKQLSWTSSRTPTGASQLFMSRWNDAEARRRLGLSPSRTQVAAAEVAVPTAPLQTAADISALDLQKRVRYLASDALGGRGTGTQGEALATAYAAQAFAMMGLAPAGDGQRYLQAFEFTAGVELGAKNRLTAGGKQLKLNTDFMPLVFSQTGEVPEAEVVFAGYGIKAPESKDFEGYDSYVHLDVKDKWVMVLRYWPEDVNEDQQQELKRHASLRYKAMVAREAGARGLIVVNGPNTSDNSALVRFDGSAAGAKMSIPVLSVNTERVLPWFTQAKKDPAALQKRLDQGQFVNGFTLPVKLSAHVDLKRIQKQGHNVLGLLKVPGATRTVVLGAHMDHLGTGHTHSSLARQDKDGDLIHHGADDNASGSAGVLEIAEALAANPRGLKQNVLFALWSGEELGLLGSSHYVNTSPSLAKMSAYLNMDMVGRFEKALAIQGTGSSPDWNSYIEKSNLKTGLPLVLQSTAYLPTDTTAFYSKGIPSLNFFTGAHSDYHTPGDTADKINYPGTERVIRLMHQLTRRVASQPEALRYQKQAPPKQEQSRGLRVYLGTIPDYASGDIKGVRLSGTSAGGPAEKAGLKSGDVIVNLNGKAIENIYDYTYAIDTLKIGKPAKVTVLREGQQLELTLIPGSRN